MKYTIKTIKKTLCYKANIATVKAVYPNDWKKFAYELMLAGNNNLDFDLDLNCVRWYLPHQE